MINFIDIGAAGGVKSPWKGKHINFVLMLDPFYKEKVVGKRFSTYRYAASDNEGHKPFYVCSKKANSSLHMPDYEVIAPEDKERFVVEKVTKVRCRRLDKIIPKTHKEFDFIKIDTQGHDLIVLKGMGKYIKDIVGIHIEILHRPIYKNAPSIEEIDEYLDVKGFERICGLRKNNTDIFNDYLYLSRDKELKFKKKQFIKKVYNIQ